MSEWKETTLGQLVTFQRGHDLSQTQFEEGKYPIIGSNGIIGYHNKFTTRKNGITIGRSGNIGSPFYIEEDFWAHNTTLYVKEFHNSYPKFVYYLLKTFNFQNFNSGSAVPSLNRNYIHPYPVYVPDYDEQVKIAAVLSCLDRKISNLRQQNETLERIAQTLFKHWFVDFEFPNEDGKPYRSSGGEMVRSELGEIPAGWRVGTS
jgi:type I restriction enzyme S subunit